MRPNCWLIALAMFAAHAACAGPTHSHPILTQLLVETTRQLHNFAILEAAEPVIAA